MNIRGNYPQLRRAYIIFRNLCAEGKIKWQTELNSAQIDFLTLNIKDNPEWDFCQATELYLVLFPFSGVISQTSGATFPRPKPTNFKHLPYLKQKRGRIAFFDNERKMIGISFYYSDALVEHLKNKFKNRFFDSEALTWFFDLTDENKEKLKAFCIKFGFTLSTTLQPFFPEFFDNYIQSYSGEKVAMSLPLRPGIELYPYQSAGVDYLIRTKRALIADEMGLGKTLQALSACLRLNKFPVLVVSPNHLKINWADEISKFSYKKALILNSTRKKRKPGQKHIVLDKKSSKNLPEFINSGFADFVIVNYEGLKTFFVESSEIVKRGKTKKKLYKLNSLAELFRSVIIEEGHNLRNSETERTKLAMLISKGKDVRFVLTGTPIEKAVTDIYPQLQILGRETEFGTRRQFENEYGGLKAGMLGRDKSQFSFAFLNDRLRALCMVRREKSKVLPQLPDKVRQYVRVEISNEEEYKLIEDEFATYLLKQGRSPEEIARSLAAEMLVKIGALKKASARGKVKAFKEFADDLFKAGEKIVVFVHHKEIIAALRKEYPGLLEVSGDVSNEEVDTAVKLFQTSKLYQLIVLTYPRGNTGLTLTAANIFVALEFAWNPGTQQQAEDRIHRIGQKASNVTCYYFVGEGTIDDRILEIIDRKRAIFQSAVDEQTDTEEVELTAADLNRLLIQSYMKNEKST